MGQRLFGDALRALLRETSVRDLAHAIHVEQSVVYRWIRNERVPHLNTDHIVHIATYLRLDPHAIDQLKQAQITSLSQTPIGPAPRKRVSGASRIAVNRFLEQTRGRSGHQPLAEQWRTPTALAQTRTLGSTTLHGTKAILQVAIEIIQHAQPDSSGKDATILLSTQGEALFAGLLDTSALDKAWRQTLRDALRRGWKIEQLWRLDKDVSRSLHIVESMLDLLGIGGYHPRYFDRYGLLRPPYELLIVPRNAAMLLLASESTACADGAIVLTDPEQVKLTTSHFTHMRNQTKPLLHAFPLQRPEMEFTQAIVNAESKPGGRLFVQDGPSAITHPPSWLQHDSLFGRSVLLNGLVTESDLPTYMIELKRRLATFERLVQHYEYLDVCPSHTLRHLCTTGEYHPDVPLHGQEASIEFRLEHVERILHLLHTHENYQLALVDEQEEQALHIELSRLIAGDSNVFITARTLDASDNQTTVQMQIAEATIVAAFREHFMDMWERVSPRHKQKSDVIAWLEYQAELLRQCIRVEAHV